MSNRIKKLLAVLLPVAFGVVFIVFGATSMKEMREYKPIPAVVSHIEREWTPNGDGTDTEEIRIFVTYTVDGKEYTEQLQNTKTNYQQGDEITVLYNPEDPTEVSGATKGIATIQFVAGAALVLAGLGTLAALIIKRR